MARVTDESRQRFSKERLADKNPNWKADKVGYFGPHGWIKTGLHKPQF